MSAGFAKFCEDFRTTLLELLIFQEGWSLESGATSAICTKCGAACAAGECFEYVVCLNRKQGGRLLENIDNM